MDDGTHDRLSQVTLEQVESLVQASWDLRWSDLAGMVDLAKSAVEASHYLEPARYGVEPAADLQARAWANLANSLRVADQLELAHLALHRALELRNQGSGCPLLRARLAELAASLLCDQRQFPEALRLSKLAEAIYRKSGAWHEAGRALARRGLQTGRSGDPEAGIRLLAQALQLINRDRDPSLVFQTLHNILVFRVEQGDLQIALLQLRDMRPLYDRHAEPIALLKLEALEGKILFGLGRLSSAEAAFLKARESFEREGLEYDAALVSLDLAMVWLQQGRKAEVRPLVRGMMETFQSRHILRETLAALLLLCEAADPAA